MTAPSADADAVADGDEEAVPAAGARRARPYVSFLLSLAGLGLSVYLTYAHYNEHVTLACPESRTINCEKVTTSPQSMLFGHIPVALAGAVYFAAMCVLSAPALWRARSRLVAWARITGAVAGMGFVIYLVAMELLVVKAICLYCTAVHAVTFVLFLVVITGWYDTGWATDRWSEAER